METQTFQHVSSSQHFPATLITRNMLSDKFWQIPLCEVSQWILCAAWTKLPNRCNNLLPSGLLSPRVALQQDQRLTLPWKPAGAPCPTANT